MHDSAPTVMSQETMLAVARMLLAETDDHDSVTLVQTVRALTSVNTAGAIEADDSDTVRLNFRGSFGRLFSLSVATNQLEPASLRRVIAHAKQFKPTTPPPLPPAKPEDLDDFAHHQYDRRTYLPVSLWHDPSTQAMATARAAVVPRMVTQLQTAEMHGTATIGLTARAQLVLYRLGRTAYCNETDCEVTVAARTPDFKTSGWSGQAHRDWTQLNSDTIVTQAIDMANRNRNRVALEPGRRTAILGPAAVAQLLSGMVELFWAESADVGGTPFSMPEGSKTRNKIGQRIFDPRLMLVSDPADPAGGFPPFFEEGPDQGFPTPAMTWIDRGVLTNLAYNVGYAMHRGKLPVDIPWSPRMMAAPGTKTATIDEMIANCAEGVYVHRFSNVDFVDTRSGLMTGVTRDGCFYVKHGKIDKPIKNFRFLDSPIFAFNRIEMIGTSERVAFGAKSFSRRIPRLPVIVPPMMVGDFNFSALADAV